MVTFVHSECLIRAGFFWKIFLKCHNKPEGKSVSQFLCDKANEFKDTVKRERSYLRANSDLKSFIRADREKLIPIWNGEDDSNISSKFDEKDNYDDDMSVGENWEDDL